MANLDNGAEPKLLARVGDWFRDLPFWGGSAGDPFGVIRVGLPDCNSGVATHATAANMTHGGSAADDSRLGCRSEPWAKVVVVGPLENRQQRHRRRDQRPAMSPLGGRLRTRRSMSGEAYDGRMKRRNEGRSWVFNDRRARHSRNYASVDQTAFGGLQG
jgi:hypothetical protein